MKPVVAFPSRHQSSQVCAEAKQLLIDAGFQIVGNEDGRKLTPDEHINMIRDAFAVVAGTEKYSEEILEHCKNLKLIVRYGVGIDNFDMDALRRRKIKVGIISNSNAVAEFTLTLILGLLKNLPNYNEAARDGQWDRYDMRELTGKTVGIIGFGRIGKRLTELLSGFNVNLLVYSRHTDPVTAQKHHIKYCTIDELLNNSDIISLHLPATPDTYHFINKETISKMKDHAYFINTSRGSLVDEAALYDALVSDKLAGAALDVYEKEPIIINHPLASLKNTILAPHVAALTYETNYNAGLICARSIINVFHGGEAEYPVI